MIELAGLELWAHHGVEEAERESGQRFLFDVWLYATDERGRYTDRIEDTVDYREVVAAVREVSDSRRFRLLEALATAVADELLARFPLHTAVVRVRKPDVDLGVPVLHAGVNVQRSRVPGVRAYVGLGSNLGDREASLREAVDRLRTVRGVEVATVTSFHETDPVGLVDQPRFLNAAVAVETELPPRTLLDRLLEIERDMGRTREGPRFGPRTIDLDLLLYGKLQLDEPGLTIPHPRLHERRFALEPLVELDPALEIPGRGPVSALLAALD
jgi:2-amino-4-hydroxy-6-hydroxymethyldihydropteridine diphosphokinase/dihydroneopterin aldolase